MENHKVLSFALLTYSAISVLFLIYILPFIFIGYRSGSDEIIVQKTVLAIHDGTEYPRLTQMAIWFAEYKTARLLITALLLLGMIYMELGIPFGQWKIIAYYVVMWVCLFGFLISFMGLLAILV